MRQAGCEGKSAPVFGLLFILWVRHSRLPARHPAAGHPPPQNRHSEVSRHARKETAARSFTVVTEPLSWAFGSRRGQTATARTPAKTQVYYLISVFFCSGLNLQYERAKISQWLAFGTEAGKTNQLGGNNLWGCCGRVFLQNKVQQEQVQGSEQGKK